MAIQLKADSFIDERIEKYDQWLAQGKISFSSKVIPITRSLEACQYVLPTEQVSVLLKQANSIALAECDCRKHYQRCDNPLEVCIYLNEFADQYVSLNQARYVAIDQALNVLEIADEKGLVHLSLYMPDHEIFALCSCCSCCCHDLQIMRLYNRKDLTVRSDYVAVMDFDACSHCGTCIDRCIFGARYWLNGKMKFDAELCYGCGLCVTKCPAEAITMRLK